MNQPLYKKIFTDLHTAILNGTLPVDSQVPTEKELSEQYQVSRITSKRALTELEQAGLIYRLRGKGSFVKANAQENHKEIGSKRILFLLPFLNDLSVGNFTDGLNPVMKKQQFDVMMMTLDFLEGKTAQDIMNEFDGLIYYPLQTEQHLALLFELSLKRFPVVILDKKIYELAFPAVLSDNLNGGKIATEYLIQNGHKNIAYLFGSKEHPQSVRQRYLGYLQALNNAKIDVHTSLDDYFIETQELINSIHQNNTTAFVCENDLTAIQTINRLKKSGYSFPEDFSIIGFDDIQAAALIDPPLTTIAQDFEQLGSLAGEKLIALINGEVDITDTNVPVSLIKRQTVKERKYEYPRD
ncbi:transcriptional regulator, GntR family [Enterococcus faecalis 13-SD-W-01]|nr:transcriptional regulator, GntR family [Enterococcus faecalis 13-SD-W-01]